MLYLCGGVDTDIAVNTNAAGKPGRAATCSLGERCPTVAYDAESCWLLLEHILAMQSGRQVTLYLQFGCIDHR
jgi:hypothetical protein